MDTNTQTGLTPEQEKEFMAELAKITDENGVVVDKDGKPLQPGEHELPNGMRFTVEVKEPQPAAQAEASTPDQTEPAMSAPAPAQPEQPTAATEASAPAAAEPEQPVAAAEAPAQPEQAAAELQAPASTADQMRSNAIAALGKLAILPNPDPAHESNKEIIDGMSNLITLNIVSSVYPDEANNVATASANLTKMVNQRRTEAGLQTIAPETILAAINLGMESAAAERDSRIMDGEAPVEAITDVPQTAAAQEASQAETSWAAKAQAVKAVSAGMSR